MSGKHSPVARRRFLAGAGAVTAGGLAGPVLLDPATGARAGVRTTAGGAPPPGVFTLGVASGDPSPDGFVLWTRLAPRPVAGGGMPKRDVQVAWEVADDARFRRRRARGVATARPGLGHSVHVEVRGLAPDREYFYRFRAGRQVSPAGRARTAPAAGARVGGLRFAFASCQSWQDGYYSVYDHLAGEDVAFVAFLGDYIYESRPSDGGVRRHEGTGEPYTLEQYRNRYGQYRGDPQLQAAHAAFPWIVTLDDHEVDNNWAGLIPQDPASQPAKAFRARRKAAFQAYYEHMPLRRSSLPRGLDLRLYRRLTFGRLAALHVLDTRQYRSDQPSSEAQANDPARTITGAAQERWLARGLTGSGARWNVLANQVMVAQSDEKPGPERGFGDWDQWDGYRAQRRRLMELFGSGRVANPVVVTGDRHATWVSELRTDFDDPASRVVGAEFVGTSVTSGGDSDQAAFHRRWDPLQAENPHWRYFDGRRGYFVCDLTSERMVSRLRVVDTVRRAEGTAARTAAEFVVEAGRPGVTVASQDPARPAVKHAPVPAAPDNDKPLA